MKRAPWLTAPSSQPGNFRSRRNREVLTGVILFLAFAPASSARVDGKGTVRVNPTRGRPVSEREGLSPAILPTTFALILVRESFGGHVFLRLLATERRSGGKGSLSLVHSRVGG